MRGDELGDLVHLVRVPVLLQVHEVLAAGSQEALLVEPGRGVDHRARCRSAAAAEDRGRCGLGRHFALVRSASGGGLRLLLSTTGGEEAEDQEGDQAEDQEVHDLQAFEAITHEHRGEQATGGQAGQRAEPARCAAGGSGLTTCGGRGGCRLRLRRGLASLVARRGTEGLAAAKALGVGFEAEGQRQAQDHGDTEETLHHGFLSCGKAWAASCPARMGVASDRMFLAFAWSGRPRADEIRAPARTTNGARRLRPFSASRRVPSPTAPASRSPAPGKPASRPRCGRSVRSARPVHRVPVRFPAAWPAAPRRGSA